MCILPAPALELAAFLRRLHSVFVENGIWKLALHTMCTRGRQSPGVVLE